jgi:hypothetical protein
VLFLGFVGFIVRLLIHLPVGRYEPPWRSALADSGRPLLSMIPVDSGGILA